MMKDYQEFLKSKATSAVNSGFEPPELNPMLFPFQRDIVKWALRKGRAAIFADCGLGKTPMQLEWAHRVAEHTGGKVLILAPLAVSWQTKNEGEKFHIPVNIAKEQEDIRTGINITNYERLDKFDCTEFSGVVLDESSILKSFMGKTKTQIIDSFSDTPYKLACTATPAPNDHMELGNHADFLGIMPSNEMLSRWFINDTMNFGAYRLKHHAVKPFWQWVSTWAVCLASPADMGYPADSFKLPEMTINKELLRVDLTVNSGDQLFRTPTVSATDIHKEGRLTAPEKARRIANLVKGSGEQWIVWCNTNYETDELMPLVDDAVEIRGSDSVEKKESVLVDFVAGKIRVLVSKSSMLGFGMNFQNCRNAAFFGLSYSYESYYQAVRRIYRFGQKRPVNIHLIMAETERQIFETVLKKQEEHEKMKANMYKVNFSNHQEQGVKLVEKIEVLHEKGNTWEMFRNDCIADTAARQENSVDFTVYSPPFSNLYIYSDSIADMGNSVDDSEFFEHYKYLIRNLFRITKPGRLSAVHCKQLVNYKGRDGMAGLRDFRGEIIKMHTEAGWAYHSEVCIWKDPVIEMQRTKSHGLLYKQLRKDSTFSRQGLPDYLLVFRKWADEGQEVSPVSSNDNGNDPKFTSYAGEIAEPVKEDGNDHYYAIQVWQRYASPVWMDIRQTNVLNVKAARENGDEKHLCPLQLDVIERALQLWTNPGDLVLSPFAGIGSEGYQALKMGRRFVGIELKESYWKQAVVNLKAVEATKHQEMELFA